jgi:hypothetical protein
MKVVHIMRIAIVFLSAALTPIWAQGIKLPANLEKLAAKAESSVDVTLDSSMLRLAARFLSDKDSDEAKAKQLITGLDSLTVRSFEFAREGEYDRADVDAVRAQLQSPAWSRIVGVKSKDSGEDVDVYLKSAGNGQLGGVVMISAKPKALTIVTLTGTLDPARLADLGGQFHIPKIYMTMSAGRREWK